MMCTGPNEIMVASKAAIQKILVEDDFRKSPLYTLTQEDPHVSNLFTETDTKVYKQKVCTSSFPLQGGSKLKVTAPPIIRRFLHRFLERVRTAYAVLC